MAEFPHPDQIQYGVKQAEQGKRYQFYAGACYLLHAKTAAMQGATGLTVKFFTSEDPDSLLADQLKAVLAAPDERDKDAPDIYFPHGIYIEVDGVSGNTDVALVEADWVPREAYCRAYPDQTRELIECWSKSAGRDAERWLENFDPGDPDSGEWDNEGAAGTGGTSGAPTVVVSTSDPTVNDDSGDGYTAGDIWINTTDDGVFILADATGGAAVWLEVGTGGGGLSNPITLTATENDVAALTIDVDAAGFSDVEALDINYDTGALSSGEDEAIILINIDETGATGGQVSGVEVLATEGSADSIYGLFVGAGVGPIEQLSGTFTDADVVNDNGTDETTALSDGGAGNVSCFEADNEYLLVESASQFMEIEVDIDTGASGSGIAPTFEYSTGAGTWTTFGPVDGTAGMLNTGVIAWVTADVSTWATGDGGNYIIRITRTRNSLTTTPILDKVQVAATVEYGWDKNADISARGLATTQDIVMDEQSDHSSTPAAGKGYIWTKNTTPSTLIFTDDAGNDRTLGAHVDTTTYKVTVGTSTLSGVAIPTHFPHTSSTLTSLHWCCTKSIAASGSNYLTIAAKNEPDGTTMQSSVYDTQSGYTANAWVDLGIDQNNSFDGTGDSIEVTHTQSGTVTSLNGHNLMFRAVYS